MDYESSQYYLYDNGASNNAAPTSASEDITKIEHPYENEEAAEEVPLNVPTELQSDLDGPY